MSKGEEKDTKPTNLVRVDEKLWSDEEPSCASVGEQRCGFIFRQDGDWFGSDRYIIVRMLGKGGMCEVWLARDRSADHDDPKRFVAIKVLQSKLEIDEKSRKRLKAEALAFMKIKKDPNLPRVYHADIDSERNLFYYVMEYLRGETLEDRLQRGALPVAEAMRIIACVAEATYTIHGLGIIHRDLKPANVFITEDGRVVLLDLGVAKFDEERFPGRSTFRTDDASIAGTFAYMSPEQSLGEELDVRSDIYALGVMGYQCIAGFHPAQRSPNGPMPTGLRAWSSWHINNQPASLLFVVPGLIAPVWAVISKAIEKDRALRFTTAKELATEFRALESTAREIESLIGSPPSKHNSTNGNALDPQATTLPDKTQRGDAEAQATTERTEHALSPGSPVEGGSPPAPEDPFDPRRIYTRSRAVVLLPPSAAEARPAVSLTADGTEIIPRPPRSSVAASGPRTEGGTDIIPARSSVQEAAVSTRTEQRLSRPSDDAPGSTPAPGAVPREAEPRRPVAPEARRDQSPSTRVEGLRASPVPREKVADEPTKPAASMRSTPSTHAIPIVRTRPAGEPRRLPRRILAFGLGGLVLGLAGAVVVALVKPNARAGAPTVTVSASPTVSVEPPTVNVPNVPVSVVPSTSQGASPPTARPAFSAASSARPSPRTVPAPRSTTTTSSKPKSDRVLD